MNLNTEMMDAVVTAQHVADLVNHPGVLEIKTLSNNDPVVHLSSDKFTAEFGDHLDGMGIFSEDYFIKWIMVAGVKVFCLTYRKQPETCRERLQRENPEKVDLAFCGGCYGCPHGYGYAKLPAYCEGGPSEACQRCWDRPVEEDGN